MARTTSNIILNVWDNTTDLFNHTQLAANWDAIAIHDHTSGHGLPIGTSAISDSSITTAKLATSAVTNIKIADGVIADGKFQSPNNATWRPIFRVTGFLNATTAGDFLGDETGQFLKVGSSVFHSIPFWRPDTTGFIVPNRTATLRIRSYFAIGATPPGTINFTPKLYPITATNGTTTNWSVTIGSPFSDAGSVTNPSANAGLVNTGTGFTQSSLPANFYALGFTTDATMAVNSSIMATLYLEMAFL